MRDFPFPAARHLPADAGTGSDGTVLAFLRQGLALHRQGRLDEAAKAYEQALGLAPGASQAAHLLGLVEHQRGNNARAYQLIGQALAAQPKNPDYLTDMALVLGPLGRAGEAEASLRSALAARPADIRALGLLAGMLVKLGRREEAAGCYRIAIGHDPHNAHLHNNLGNTLTLLGDKPGAIAALRQAIALAPDLADAQSNLGYVLNEVGDYPAAIAACRRALQLNPEAPGPRFNLALALLSDDQPAAAAEAFFDVLRRQPHNAEAMRSLGDCLVKLGRTEEAIAQYAAAVAERPNFAAALTNLIFHQNYRADLSIQDAVAEARHFGEVVAAGAKVATAHRNTPDPERRLRVGLVSGDFGEHPVGRFLAGPLAAIDRNRIELFAYATIDREDAMTARLRQLVPNWRKVFHLTDAELSALIQGDRIDILIDLSGHSSGNRLAMFAHKPAPIAVTWLGYFATTGLAAIDYVLANRWVIPEAEESQWVEKPWRLPDTYLCFAPPPVEVDLAELPARRHGAVTFGSANNLNKLSEETLACWAAILHAVDDSRLALRTAAFRDADRRQALLARFAALGVGAERLVLEPAVADYAGHLARYNDVDIALDPFPYAGGTTTVEALWMGVPVLTRRGDRYVAHMGESIMHNMDLADWIAADTDDYIRKAAAFAADLDRLAGLRTTLRPRLLASPLMDAPAFARELEQAFRGMWQIWCTTRPPSAPPL